MAPVTDVTELLKDRAWSAFYHQRVDGTVSNGFCTNGKATVQVDAEDVERLRSYPAVYEAAQIDGTPIVHVRRKI